MSAVVAPATVAGSAGPRTAYTYHPDGRMHTRTAPNGDVTTWTYVAAGPQTITETVSPGVNRTTNVIYTAQGRPHIVTDPTSRQTEMHYNALGDLDWIRDHAGHQTAFEYDAMGRLEKTVLPATTPPNDSPRTSYDTVGRVWRVMNPNGSFWRHWYDGGGRRRLTHDPEAHPTDLEYDAYGRPETVTDALGAETHYGYDLMSRLISLTDARGKTTSFEYDGHGRVKKVTYPGSGTPPPSEQFAYDLAGRPKTRTDRKGVVTTYTYDGQGRLTGKTYSDGSPAASYGYDANGDVGFMTSASNSADSLAWDFDLAGQLNSEASTRNATTVSYGYDLAGRRSALRLNGADVLTYDYHDDGELETITRAPGVAFVFTPDAAHRRQTMTFPNGTTTEYEYDLLSRLSRIRLKRGAVVVSDIAYESNDLDNRTSRAEDGTRLQYGYDELSRLLTVDRTLPTPAVRQEEYTYDPVGNRLDGTRRPRSVELQRPQRAPELQRDHRRIRPERQPDFTQRESGADVRVGRRESARQRSRQRRERGLARIRPLFGRRVAKTTSAGTTLFAYDGEDILVENGPSGSFLYVHGPGVDEPLARGSVTGILTRFYHLDGLGSLVKRTDANGNLENLRTYDSFGQPAVYRPSGHAFTSRESDGETGLYYYRARYYDPKIGRFLSEDPIAFGGGINFYAYVANSPINRGDPTGLQWPGSVGGNILVCQGSTGCRWQPPPPPPGPADFTMGTCALLYTVLGATTSGWNCVRWRGRIATTLVRLQLHVESDPPSITRHTSAATKLRVGALVQCQCFRRARRSSHLLSQCGESGSRPRDRLRRSRGLDHELVGEQAPLVRDVRGAAIAARQIAGGSGTATASIGSSR